MAILEAVHYFTTVTIFIILSLILYLRFTTGKVKSVGQHFCWNVNCEVVNWVMTTNYTDIRKPRTATVFTLGIDCSESSGPVTDTLLRAITCPDDASQLISHPDCLSTSITGPDKLSTSIRRSRHRCTVPGNW